jgi:hypothetical protein
MGRVLVIGVLSRMLPTTYSKHLLTEPSENGFKKMLSLATKPDQSIPIEKDFYSDVTKSSNDYGKVGAFY